MSPRPLPVQVDMTVGDALSRHLMDSIKDMPIRFDEEGRLEALARMESALARFRADYLDDIP